MTNDTNEQGTAVAVRGRPKRPGEFKTLHLKVSREFSTKWNAVAYRHNLESKAAVLIWYSQQLSVFGIHRLIFKRSHSTDDMVSVKITVPEKFYSMMSKICRSRDISEVSYIITVIEHLLALDAKEDAEAGKTV